MQKYYKIKFLVQDNEQSKKKFIWRVLSEEYLKKHVPDNLIFDKLEFNSFKEAYEAVHQNIIYGK